MSLVTCVGMEEERRSMGGKEKDVVHDIVIVGGGICGLATALALHRKGIGSLVLEKSVCLRAAGAAIGIHGNGWRSLDYLEVGMELREKTLPAKSLRILRLGNDRPIVIPYRSEFRTMRRRDLIETLASYLPDETIRFGCHVVDVTIDPITSFPVVTTSDGNTITAKVLIGCDGSNSVVAKFLGLKAPKFYPSWVTRGFTNYPSGHKFGHHFLQQPGENVLLGRVQVDDKLVFFFAGSHHYPPEDSSIKHDPKLIREFALRRLQGYPDEVIDMVRHCDIDSLSIMQTCYRPPWHLIFARFQKGNVVVAGDAMHATGPFIGQGGSASLEDAVVLARCLAPAVRTGEGIEAALTKYVRERWGRIMRLSTQSYLVGELIVASSWFKKVAYNAMLKVLFGGNTLHHTQFDCGPL